MLRTGYAQYLKYGMHQLHSPVSVCAASRTTAAIRGRKDRPMRLSDRCMKSCVKMFGSLHLLLSFRATGLVSVKCS
ncbi:hypothetical protein XENOCAPTIV_020500, partial [Xenoophorus captivus]